MPFYTFTCSDCHTHFTLRRPIQRRDEEAECPDCGSQNCLRMLSIPMLATRDDSGNVQPLSASACGGCAATSCAGCGTLTPR